MPGEEFTAHVNFVCHRLEEMQLTGDLDQFNDVIKQQMPSFVQNATVEEEREAKLGSFCVFCVLFGGVCCDFNAMCCDCRRVDVSTFEVSRHVVQL